MKTIFKFLIAISLFSIATVYADTTRVFTPLEGTVSIGVNDYFVIGYNNEYQEFYKLPIDDMPIDRYKDIVPIGVNNYFVVGYDNEYREFYKVPIDDIPIGW